MSNRNIESMDEKYLKIGKIFHAVMINTVGIEDLESYFKSCGILSEEELAKIEKDILEYEQWHINVQSNIYCEDDSGFHEGGHEYTHMINDNGEVVEVEVIMEDENV